MKRIAQLSAIVLLPLLMLTACDRINVERVRAGTLDFDDTKTLGDALGNLDLISDGKWSGFEATDGRQVVEFNGKLDGLQQALDETFAEIKKNPEAAAMAALAGGGEMGPLGLAFLVNSPLGIDSCSYQIQFLLSKRDDGFSAGAASLKANIANKKTGTNQECTFEDNDHQILKAIYENDKSAIALYVLSQAMQAELGQGLIKAMQE